MVKRINIRHEDLPYRITNLPSAILTGCKDKHTLLSVAISIFIKTHHGDSRFTGTSIRAIKKFFGVGQAKAEKIAKIIRYEGKFFKYNPFNDSVVAKTFKNKTIATKDRFGRNVWMMYAVKLKIDKAWTLRQIEVYIHDMLYLRAINATERSDKFYSCREIKNGILLTTKDALTLTKMKNIAGVCRSTAKRHLQRLAKNHTINIKKGYSQLVLTSVSKETIKEYGLEHVNFIHDTKRDFAYIVVPNEYNIINRSITQSFRNIIFNSKKRQTYNAPTKNVDIMNTQRMAMFD